MRRVGKYFLVSVLVASFFATGFANADSYFSGNDASGTLPGSDGGDLDVSGNWAWRAEYVAWFKYVFKDTASTSTAVNTTLPFDNYVRTGTGETGTYLPKGKNASFDANCLKWSKSIYVSGNVLVIKEDSADGYLNMFNRQRDGYNYNQAFHGLYWNVRYSAKGNYVTQRVYLGRAGTGADNASAREYYRLTSEDIPDYVDHVEVVPFSDAETAWNKAKQYSTDTTIKNSSLSDSKYTVFCGGEKADSYGNYKGQAKIEVNYDGNNDDNFGSPDVVAATDGTSSKAVEITTGSNTRTIKYKAFGKTEFDNSAAVPSGYTNKYTGTAYYVYRGEDGSLTPTSLLYKTVTTGYAGDGAILTLSIKPGETKTVCAINRYFKTYRSKDTNQWHDATNSAKACVTVKYNSTAYNMGTASQIVVSQNGVRKANAFNIDQNSKNTSTGDRYGNGTGTTGSINNSFSQPSSVTVSSGIKPGNIEVFALNKVTKLSKEPKDAPDADIKLIGLTVQNPSNNSDACSDTYLDSTIYHKDCYNAGDATKIIYPEQTVTYTATTSVPSQIKASGEVSGTKVTTSASVTVTADPLTCKNFNNAKIGQNNPINYGRITFSGDDNISAGNLKDGGWRENSVVYLAPKTNYKYKYFLTYTGCMGHQVPLDIDGGNNPALTLYGVSTSGKADNWMRYWYDDLSVSNAVSSATGAIAGRNVSAAEVGKNGLARIQNNYEFKADTEKVYIENESVGYTTTNHFIWDNGIDSAGAVGNKEVTLEMRVPYNYYIDDYSHLDPSDEGIFVGSKPSFALKTIVNPRDNKDVGLGSYATDVYKNTKRTVTSLYINENVSAETIRNKLSKIIIDGEDATDSNSVYHVLNDLIPGAVTVGKVETETFSNKDEMEKLSQKFTFDEVESGQIGQKLCVAVAYYPADSHNNVDVNTELQVTPGEIAKGSDQSMALNGPWYYEGAKTLITTSCATIGKKPTASIEGGSLMTGGQANGYTTTYKGNVFGSWAEYDLLSNTGSNGIGSGASLAYANQSGWINLHRQDGDGLKSDSGGVKMIMNPQSIGNTNNKTDYGSNGEALKVVGRKNQSTSVAWAFAENIYSTIIEPAVSGGTYNTAIANVRKSNVANDSSFGNEKNKLYVIYNDGSIEINDDIVNDTATSVYVIYSRTGINIKPNVKRIDAFLIADNDSFTGSNSGTAYIDTCSGSGEVDGVTYELDRGGMPGNYHLLVNCNETLVVNGAVAANIIELDRAAGGGSDEKMTELNAASLTQRAEIFNYDQRIVFWATNASSSDKTTTANHVKELTPRL